MSQAKAELSVARGVFIPIGKAQLEGELHPQGSPRYCAFRARERKQPPQSAE